MEKEEEEEDGAKKVTNALLSPGVFLKSDQCANRANAVSRVHRVSTARTGSTVIVIHSMESIQ
jgi:hypothetical protein